MCVSLPLWCFQPLLYRSLLLIRQLGARCASSQPVPSLLLFTLPHGQIQALGLTYTPSHPFWNGGAALSAVSFSILDVKRETRGERRSEQERQREGQRGEIEKPLWPPDMLSSGPQPAGKRSPTMYGHGTGLPYGQLQLLPFSGGRQSHCHLRRKAAVHLPPSGRQ